MYVHITDLRPIDNTYLMCLQWFRISFKENIIYHELANDGAHIGLSNTLLTMCIISYRCLKKEPSRNSNRVVLSYPIAASIELPDNQTEQQVSYEAINFQCCRRQCGAQQNKR